MIELRGGRYVQVSGDKKSGDTDDPMETMMHRSLCRMSAPRDLELRIDSSQSLPRRISHLRFSCFAMATVKKLSEYTIADGVLYTRSDYYTNGYWNRKIELSSLNLPETIKSNQSRGVRFQLPSAPNEVTVGP